VRRLFALPRYRAMFLADGDLGKRALPLLRAELRAGQLGFEEAATTLHLVNRLYGGLAVDPMLRITSEPSSEQQEEERREERRALDAFLGPEHLQGPPTEEEWRAFRALRDQHQHRGVRDWGAGLMALPDGPWHPEDRAFLDRALAARRDGLAGIDHFIAMAVAAHPDRSGLAIFAEMRGWPGVGRDFLSRLQRRLMEAIGLEMEEAVGLPGASSPGADPRGEAPRAPAKAGTSAGEWMDEPEAEER
jgi:hypothetical protein